MADEPGDQKNPLGLTPNELNEFSISRFTTHEMPFSNKTKCLGAATRSELLAIGDVLSTLVGTVIESTNFKFMFVHLGLSNFGNVYDV